MHIDIKIEAPDELLRLLERQRQLVDELKEVAGRIGSLTWTSVSTNYKTLQETNWTKSKANGAVNETKEHEDDPK